MTVYVVMHYEMYEEIISVVGVYTTLVKAQSMLARMGESASDSWITERELDAFAEWDAEVEE